MNEAAYQRKLVKKIERLLPGCHVQRNDPSITQGIPDLQILFEDRWAFLEVKTSADSPVQPNQEFYVERFNGMSFAAFIFPENEAEVLHELQRALASRRRVS